MLPTELFILILQTCLCIFFTVNWEAAPSATGSLFCETSSQFGFKRQTCSLLFRLSFKLFIFLQVMSKSGSGYPNKLCYYRLCWEMHEALLYSHSPHFPHLLFVASLCSSFRSSLAPHSIYIWLHLPEPGSARGLFLLKWSARLLRFSFCILLPVTVTKDGLINVV